MFKQVPDVRLLHKLLQLAVRLSQHVLLQGPGGTRDHILCLPIFPHELERLYSLTVNQVESHPCKLLGNGVILDDSSLL